MYPAVLPAVVGVAALDNEDNAAPFTNYGPWVRACTAGVDVTSIFFKGFNGAEPSVGGDDPDDFKGWAVWSGTSFAAPRVVAALAQKVAAGTTPHEAVRQLVDDPALPRKPMLGTVVDPV
jgi:subtilisin family serine protease